MKKELVLSVLIGIFLILSIGVVSSATVCSDLADNDGDGGIDAFEEDFSMCGQIPCAECSDGIDNDFDGLVDFNGDAGCATPNDNSERVNDANCLSLDYPTEKPECSDGGVGGTLFDFPLDPDCDSLRDPTEEPDPTAGPVTECNDGKDNNFDGLTDALVELDPNNRERLFIGGSGQAKTICEFAMSKDLTSTITTCNGYGMILSVDAPWDDGTDSCSFPVKKLHPTIRKVCNLAGYRDFYYYDSWVPADGGKCNSFDPIENKHWYWEESNNRFIETSSNPLNGRRYIVDLECINRLPACSNGIDDDDDGLIDFGNDGGCFSKNDDSEKPHDPSCISPEDPIEDVDPCIDCVPTTKNSVNYCDLTLQKIVHDVIYDTSSCLSICEKDPTTVIVKDCRLTDQLCIGEIDPQSEIFKDCLLTNPYKYCTGAVCVDPGIPPADPEGTAYWSIMNKNPNREEHFIITAQVGDTILMVYDDPSLIKGSTHTFEIFGSDLLFDDKIRTISKGNAITGTVDANEKAIGIWTITKEDLGKDIIGNEEYFFLVDTVVKSHKLNILKIEDNTPPTTKIDSPLQESEFIIQDQSTPLINFNQLSSDPDDDLKITWDFGDKTTSQELLNCLTTGNCDTTHSYSTSGTKIITIKAQEMTREQFVLDSSRIYVRKKGLNIFAIIDFPDYKNNFFNAGKFSIDGTSSFVAECFDLRDNCVTSCKEKGDLLSQDCATSCEEFTDHAGGNSLWCYRFAESNAEGFTFQWTIDGEIDLEHINDNTFSKIFVKAGRHDIDLKVTYTY